MLVSHIWLDFSSPSTSPTFSTLLNSTPFFICNSLQGPPTSTFNTRPGYPGPHPTWPWTSPGTGHPPPRWAAGQAPHCAHSKELPPDIQPKSSLLQLQTIFCYSLPFQRVDSPPVSQKFTKVLGGDDTMPGIQLWSFQCVLQQTQWPLKRVPLLSDYFSGFATTLPCLCKVAFNELLGYSSHWLCFLSNKQWNLKLWKQCRKAPAN